MPNKFLRETAYIITEQAADADAPLVVRMFTPGIVNRNGIQHAPGSMSTANFMENPVLLYNHNDSRPPIGKVAQITKDGDKLNAELEFDKSDAFALEIERKMRQGYLNGVSIGYDVKEAKEMRGEEYDDMLFPPLEVLSSDLIELSVTPTPANPSALTLRKEAADYFRQDSNPPNVWSILHNALAED